MVASLGGTMETQERERMILLLAMCKLMKIDTFAGAIYGALEDAAVEVQTFDQATNPDWPNPRP